MEFEFKLTYKLPDDLKDDEHVMRCLGEQGCTDALVGLGAEGLICLEFVREASNADEAIRSALEAVKLALPNARLIEHASAHSSS